MLLMGFVSQRSTISSEDLFTMQFSENHLADRKSDKNSDARKVPPKSLIA